MSTGTLQDFAELPNKRIKLSDRGESPVAIPEKNPPATLSVETPTIGKIQIVN